MNNDENNNQFNTNCLALTIRKDYRLTIASNVANTAKRISFKVLLSMLTFNFIKIIL